MGTKGISSGECPALARSSECICGDRTLSPSHSGYSRLSLWLLLQLYILDQPFPLLGTGAVCLTVPRVHGPGSQPSWQDFPSSSSVGVCPTLLSPAIETLSVRCSGQGITSIFPSLGSCRKLPWQLGCLLGLVQDSIRAWMDA